MHENKQNLTKTMAIREGKSRENLSKVALPKVNSIKFASFSSRESSTECFPLHD